MLTSRALAKIAGAKVQTIRHYEHIRLMPEPGRTAGGQRIYGAEELDRLASIRHARQQGCGGGRTAECQVLRVLRDHSERLTEHEAIGACHACGDDLGPRRAGRDRRLLAQSVGEFVAAPCKATPVPEHSQPALHAVAQPSQSDDEGDPRLAAASFSNAGAGPERDAGRMTRAISQSGRYIRAPGALSQNAHIALPTGKERAGECVGRAARPEGSGWAGDGAERAAGALEKERR